MVAATARLALLPAFEVGARLHDLDALPLRDVADGVDEREPVRLAHELDRVAGSAASEAVIKPAILVHVEAGRLLLVERAQADVRATAQGELHAFADDGDDSRFASHAVDGFVG